MPNHPMPIPSDLTALRSSLMRVAPYGRHLNTWAPDRTLRARDLRDCRRLLCVSAGAIRSTLAGVETQSNERVE
jgi:hypothetical protein